MTKPTLKIKYKNFRGEISNRELIPLNVYYGNNQYHTEDQYLMDAIDITDQNNPKFRTFAVSDFNPYINENQIENSGYRDAFYEMAQLLGFNHSVNVSPKIMYETHILPKLKEVIAKAYNR